MGHSKRAAPASGGRRGVLKAAAVGATGSAVLAAPNVSRAQTAVLRFQSTWPSRDIQQEFAQDYVHRVNRMGGGRLRLELLAAGAVVGAFQLLDAVSAGTLDGGHGVCAYWFGKNKAFSLFGTAPPWFGDANQLLAWFYYGGGEALYNELMHDIVRANAVGFLACPIPTQPLGWFKQPIERAEQFRGMKYRTVGLAADLFAEMGAAVVSLPGGEVVPALERGVIDGAEFSNPTPTASSASPTWPRTTWSRATTSAPMLRDAVQPAEVRGAAGGAARRCCATPRGVLADMSWKVLDRFPKDMAALAQAGVNVRPRRGRCWTRSWRPGTRCSSGWRGQLFARQRPFLQEGLRQPARLVPPRGQLRAALRGEPAVAYNHFFGRA
jgi:TRAP-type mannitol/chloroaromatic compound transport system substrate-binding protein